MSATGGGNAPGSTSGLRQVILATPADPAAGAQALFTVTQQMRLAVVRYRFTASAAVANRFLALTIDDGAGHIIWDDQPMTVTANGVAVFAHYAGAGGAGTGNNTQQTSMPSLILLPGWRVRTSVNGMDVADTVTQFVIAGYAE